jgi:hypothetical protein
MHNIPPQRYGSVINNEYVWLHSKKLPEYYKNGKDFMTQYIQRDGFYMGDNEKKFQENLKTQPNNWHYRTKNITYTLNSLGYRTNEFDDISWQDSIVVFGCSCVFGVGVSDDETLTHYLGEYLDRPVINLGIPGTSNQFILDNSLILKEKYGIPYGMIVMWTTSDRLPYYGDKEFYNIGPWNNGTDDNSTNLIMKNIYQNIYFDISNENITLYNIVNTFRNIWQDKTKYYDASFFENVAHYGKLRQYFPFSNTARDLMHPGYMDFKSIAEEIKDFFK